jgi:hypothetical protein
MHFPQFRAWADGGEEAHQGGQTFPFIAIVLSPQGMLKLFARLVLGEASTIALQPQKKILTKSGGEGE